MFGIFKKKEIAPATDPAAERAAARIKEQTEVAELQSQIAELRRQSVQMNAEIARKTEERAGLMVKINAVPPAQKTSLALRVKNIDKLVAGLNGNLALVEQQIGNIEATILQIKARETVDVGNLGNTIDVKKHQSEIQRATEIKRKGDFDVGIADEMLADLTGDATSITDDVADIIAEASGAGKSVSTEPDNLPDPAIEPPSRSTSASAF